MAKKANLLISNDDGIDSLYLKALVDAHLEHFNVHVAAPASEQSWSGRSFSRHKKVTAEKHDSLNCPAWAISGTPTDCVNIALGNLLDKQPDLVISGINIGFNTGIPYILTSGTVAAALEASLWGIPGIAYSQYISEDIFDDVRAIKGPCNDALKNSLAAAASHAAKLSLQILESGESIDHGVHNINFPAITSKDSVIEKTNPGHCTIGSLFEKNEDQSYNFKFSNAVKKGITENSDYDCLIRGNISYSLLEFNLGRVVE